MPSVSWRRCCSRRELLHCLSKDGAAMGVVAEHIEARASGRKQHGIAGLRCFCSRSDGILERGAHLECAHTFQGYCDCGGVSPNEHRVAHLSAEGVGKHGEVLIL